MSEQAGVEDLRHAPTHSLAAVLKIHDFRNLWIGLGLSSLGDWMGLLALTAMANASADSYAGKNYAIATVLFLRVLPALVMGPFAGYVADKLDRRRTLVWGDYLRGALFLTIPIVGPRVGTLWWIFLVTVLVEAVSLVWGPAKDATVPNLVPRHRLEAANQISLATTYGSALPAAAIFAGLTLVDKFYRHVFDGFIGGPIDLALYFNAISFVVSGIVISRLKHIPSGPASVGGETNAFRVIVDGWKYVGTTPVVRGLVVGIIGAFAAGGVVVGLARTYVSDLGGGDSGYGLLFGTVFAGLGLGMWRGPRLLQGLSRRRLFGISLTLTGLLLFPLALVQQLPVVVGLTAVLGFFAGVGWITGNTMLGLEVPDEVRGRTFAFVGSMIRLALALVLAVVAAARRPDRHPRPRPARRERQPVPRLQRRRVHVPDRRGADDRCRCRVLPSDGRPDGDLVDDRPEARVHRHARRVRRHRLLRRARGRRGRRQVHPVPAAARVARGRGVRRPADPRAGGHRGRRRSCAGSCSTRPPATSRTAPRRCSTPPTRPSTSTGWWRRRWPAAAWWSPTATSTPRWPTRAPAATLADREVERVARWATADLRPHLTVLLDLPPAAGHVPLRGARPDRGRVGGVPRAGPGGFLQLAGLAPEHYLVVDARRPVDEIAAEIRAPAAAAARPGRPRAPRPTPPGRRGRHAADPDDPSARGGSMTGAARHRRRLVHPGRPAARGRAARAGRRRARA